MLMSTVPDLATLDELLEHAGWTRALAVRLLGDADDADDVVQETWLSALRLPPQRRHALRPWIATVVRNLVRSEGRRRQRARSRERQVLEQAGAATVPSSEELLSQVQTERALAALVLDLPEPYRHTILLRYHHGKSAADIARAEDIPEGTVRWRLKYGLGQLRQRFEERSGGRDVARGILIPFAAAASAVSLGKAALAAPVLGLSLAASSKAMVAATVALVAVGGTAVGTAVVKHRRAATQRPVLTAQAPAGTRPARATRMNPAAARPPATAAPNPVLAAAPFTVVPLPGPAKRPSPLLDIEIQATSPGQPARTIRWRTRAPTALLINVRPAGSARASHEEEPVPSLWCCRRALVVGDYVEGRACLRVPFDDSGEQCQPYGLEREVYCTNDAFGQFASGDLRRTGRLVCAGQAL
jgi:RNA polymerase sigma-70 factor (ECF subfamily)